MKLVTPVEVDPQGFTLDHGNYIMLVGSCFTEHIGSRLAAMRFPVLSNPFGIMYNPLTMAEVLECCIADRPLSADDMVMQDGLWHSWLHHGAFSREEREECLQVCNEAVHQAHAFLQRCDRLMLTFGSAWYFTYRETGRVVGNCHKVAAQKFDRRLATVEDIVTRWRPLIQQLRQQQVEVLITISPVRHWAYGAHGNQVGKAPLFLAIEQLSADSQSAVYYFPAYEILMDELRDYRFYADDLLHPSTLAEEMIWQRFQLAYMSEETITLCEKVEKLNKLQGHRMLHATVAAEKQQQTRISQLRQEVEELLEAYNK